MAVVTLSAKGVGAGLLCVSLTAAWYIGRPLRWFSLHPLGMLLAYATVACAGIQYKKAGGRLNTVAHARLMMGATLAGLGGWYVVYEQKRMLGKPHNTSWHSWMGVAVLLSYVVTACGSWWALHPDTGALKASKTIRRGHKLASRALTLLAWTTLLTGWYKMDETTAVW
eukprot:CAMPEP_0183360060 /NCGR_PEP_ID=MMETSP0164_2-20130417/54154_1 /TAXON_ID=221442 /ORGANISM="Coccolithus pelagicus ssp braarudi, Strain PLY182g" /LENGTH=168 /DNA_ID=CAMNT_0025534321 /DNA_START=19 /DNA_END=522 /DNA_ORIENTATION=-